MSSKITISKLRKTFARFELLVSVGSGNSFMFGSKELEEFIKFNGINHKFLAQYHPPSNGETEPYVQTLKQSLPVIASEKEELDLKFCRLLMQYRRIPNTITGKSPAEMLLKREMQAHINTNERHLKIEYKVMVRYYNNAEYKWRRGSVTAKYGHLYYDV